MTESEFLERQARLSKQGVRRSLQEMKRDLQRVVDLGAIVRRHPLLSLGVGTAAGFLLGNQLARPRSHARGALRSALASLVRPTMLTLRSAALAALFSETGESKPQARPGQRPSRKPTTVFGSMHEREANSSPVQ